MNVPELRWVLCLVLRFLCVGLVLSLLACSPSGVPSLDSSRWLAFQARFCTDGSSLEVWETRDQEKLLLLQSAFIQEQPELLDRVIKSQNHALVILAEGEEGPETWQVTLRLDQESMAIFNVKRPEHSFQLATDPMLYRTLNTLLSSHMGETLDIFRRCEMAQ